MFTRFTRASSPSCVAVWRSLLLCLVVACNAPRHTASPSLSASSADSGIVVAYGIPNPSLDYYHLGTQADRLNSNSLITVTEIRGDQAAIVTIAFNYDRAAVTELLFIFEHRTRTVLCVARSYTDLSRGWLAWSHLNGSIKLNEWPSPLASPLLMEFIVNGDVGGANAELSGCISAAAK